MTTKKHGGLLFNFIFHCSHMFEMCMALQILLPQPLANCSLRVLEEEEGQHNGLRLQGGFLDALDAPSVSQQLHDNMMEDILRITSIHPLLQ